MTGPRMPWVPWRIDDHLAITRGWPVVADGIYRRLLDVLWLDGSLPADESDLRAISGASRAEFQRGSKYFLHLIPVGDDGRRRNPDIAAQREDALQRYLQRNQRARDAANKRWGMKT